MQTKGARIAVAVSAIVAAAFLFLILRDDGGGEGSTVATPAVGKPADESKVTGKPANEPKPKPDETANEIQVEGGEPVGGVQEIEVTVDEPVRLLVSSPDTAEEVHVHGYDVTGELAPGKPAKIDFDATIEGVFEVELEHSATPIAELTVEP